jgi:CheY-like chemotaxis protein
MSGTASGGASPTGSASAGVVVLIVEDEAPIAEVIAEMVSDAGHRPVVAAHGRQALELARQQRPALVITDLMMPVMDGPELIAALRDMAASERRAVAPVIVMTAAGAQRAYEAGADAVLRKPFDLAEIDGLLRRLLGPRPPAAARQDGPGG